MTLRSLLHEVILGRKQALSGEQIAERLGLAYWSMMKQLNPNEEGYRFPAEMLIALMLLTKDFRILQYIARECGFVAVRVDRHKRGSRGALAEHGVVYAKYAQALQEMYESHSIGDREYEIVQRFFAEVAGHVRNAKDTHDSHNQVTMGWM